MHSIKEHKKLFALMLKGALKLLLLLIIADIAFTSFYILKGRSKVAYIQGIKNVECDYIFLGNSRVQSGVDPITIFNTSGKNGYNLGTSDATIFECKLALKSFLANNKCKKVYLQLDHSFSRDRGISYVDYLPYMFNQELFIDIVQKEPWNIMPFFRYVKYNSKIGIREIFACLSEKKKIGNNGFVPIKQYFGIEDNGMDFDLTNVGKSDFEEIKSILKKENIELYCYTAPVYKLNNTTEVESFFNDLSVNYQDFSSLIRDKKYFQDNVHLTPDGAILFSQIFTNKYFSN